MALTAYAGLALHTYRLARDPERAREGSSTWIAGPPAASLSRAAEEHIRRGLEVLDARDVEPAERYAAFLDHLRVAEDLLTRSVRANPVQARALSQLAAVRWELSPPVREDDARRLLELMALASRMAPRVPEVQLRLGELLLRMGRSEDALDYFRRTLALAPGRAWDVVALLRDDLMRPEEILHSLPTPSVLVALRRPFFEVGAEAEYLEAIERIDDFSTAGLLSAYGDACLRAAQPQRLRDRMRGLVADGRLETERRVQLSRALSALNEHEQALREAEAARAREPEAFWLSEHLGSLALRAGDAERALGAFRSALRQAARQASPPLARARLYRHIGQAEEARGRPDRAFDAYKRALALEPEEAVARRRIAEMRAAATGSAVPD